MSDPICYLGHEDCYDRHDAERRADEADWEQERYDDLGYWPGWSATSVLAALDDSGEEGRLGNG